ncbi:hypothetical protein WA158_002048 [Blastocystis sp. Blastoise]
MSIETNLCINQWKYVNEGSQHIIFRYVGEDNLFYYKILRLNKKSKYISEPIYTEEQLLISELLGTSSIYLTQPEDIILSQNTIQGFTESILSLENRDKRWKECLMSLCTNASILPNLLQIPLELRDIHINNIHTIGIEIKPKWGAMPKTISHDIQKHICRYCMQQHIKYKKGSISSISTYCPLQFFSSSPVLRMSALMSLLQNNQNNIVFFMDGTKVTLSIIEKYISFIISSFHESNIQFKKNSNEYPSSFSELSISIQYLLCLLYSLLYSSTIVHDLLNIQTCNNYEIEQLYEMKYKKPQLYEENLERYLICRGARDCSILLSFSPSQYYRIAQLTDIIKVIRIGDISWCSSMGIIDLEMKSKNKIDDWYQQEIAIVNSYLNSDVKCKKSCV